MLRNSAVHNAAYDKMSAVLSEEALAEREHARQGHGSLEGANGAADTAVDVLPAHVDVSFKDGAPAASAEPGAASQAAQASTWPLKGLRFRV